MVDTYKSMSHYEGNEALKAGKLPLSIAHYTIALAMVAPLAQEGTQGGHVYDIYIYIYIIYIYIYMYIYGCREREREREII